MKYKVGDKTVLGDIINVDERRTRGLPYCIRLIRDLETYMWFTESEIDAIIIKPKRNIDHLIELWESGSTAAKVREFMCEKRLSTLAEKIDIQKWLAPYIEPRKYPVLSSEEFKAVKWLAEGGFKLITKDELPYCDINVSFDGLTGTSVHVFPIADCLETSTWITSEPINLSELLAAQEGL